MTSLVATKKAQQPHLPVALLGRTIRLFITLARGLLVAVLENYLGRRIVPGKSPGGMAMTGKSIDVQWAIFSVSKTIITENFVFLAPSVTIYTRQFKIQYLRCAMTSMTHLNRSQPFSSRSSVPRD